MIQQTLFQRRDALLQLKLSTIDTMPNDEL